MTKFFAVSWALGGLRRPPRSPPHRHIPDSGLALLFVGSLNFLSVICRFLLSLASCKKCMVLDDQLRILPISTESRSITPIPPKSKVRLFSIDYVP